MIGLIIASEQSTTPAISKGCNHAMYCTVPLSTAVRTVPVWCGEDRGREQNQQMKRAHAIDTKRQSLMLEDKLSSLTWVFP